MEKDPEKHEKETVQIGQTKQLLFMLTPRRTCHQDATHSNFKDDHKNNPLPGQQGKQAHTSRPPTIFIKHNRRKRKRRNTTSIQTETEEKEEKEKLLNKHSVHLKQAKQKEQTK